jgi:hypothetical protein
VDVRPGIGSEANLLLRLKHMLRHPIECEGGQRPVLHVDRGGWADIRVAAYLLQTTVPTLVSAIAADMALTDVVTFEVAIYRPAPTKERAATDPLLVNQNLPVKDRVVFWSDPEQAQA